LLLGASATIVIVELAVEGDGVGSSSVEGVVAFGATRVVVRRVEVLEKGSTVAFAHVVATEDRNIETVSMRWQYGTEKRWS
jgi:hypothetical protein